MDLARLRRGKAANQLVFGEDTAILAATALLNRAFGVIAESDRLAAELRLDLTRLLSESVGSNGIIAGQFCDLRNRRGRGDNVAGLTEMYSQKTGALFVAALETGAGSRASMTLGLRPFASTASISAWLSSCSTTPSAFVRTLARTPVRTTGNRLLHHDVEPTAPGAKSIDMSSRRRLRWSLSAVPATPSSNSPDRTPSPPWSGSSSDDERVRAHLLLRPGCCCRGATIQRWFRCELKDQLGRCLMFRGRSGESGNLVRVSRLCLWDASRQPEGTPNHP